LPVGDELEAVGVDVVEDIGGGVAHGPNLR
jgi:hypothetical protein